MTQVVAGQVEPVDVVFYVDGAAADADGEVTVTGLYRDSDRSTTVLSDATAHVGAAGSGTYRYSLAAGPLDRLVLVFSGVFSGIPRSQRVEVDVVGGYHVLLHDIAALPNMAAVDITRLKRARAWWEEKFESYVNRSMVPRYGRENARWDGNEWELADGDLRAVRSVTVDGAVLTSDQLALLTVDGDRVCGLWRFASPQTARVVDIAYEHGWDRVPVRVTEAALAAIRLKLLQDESGRSPDYATTNDIGVTTRFSTPGPDRPFGLQFADEVANDENIRRNRTASLTASYPRRNSLFHGRAW